MDERPEQAFHQKDTLKYAQFNMEMQIKPIMRGWAQWLMPGNPSTLGG